MNQSQSAASIMVFALVEGATCVVYHGRSGMYSQHDIYTMDNFVFARVGTRFLKLHSNGGTSNIRIKLVKLDISNVEYHTNKLGMLVLGPEPPYIEPKKLIKQLLNVR